MNKALLVLPVIFCYISILVVLVNDVATRAEWSPSSHQFPLTDPKCGDGCLR
jgi:hypothetical protein